jgi:hypothetical protein
MLMETPCIEWPGALDDRGYGRKNIKKNGKWVTVRTHRLAWEEANGPIPDGLHVLHRCDNPPCMNPEHLMVGDHAENMRQMMERGLWRDHWEGRDTTRCKHGHLLDGDNLRVDAKGHRHCRTCRSRYNKKYKQRKAGAAMTTAVEEIATVNGQAETAQQIKNRLRNEAEREVLNAHRDELNAITERKFKENNLVYTRRLTEREKAAKKIEELLEQHPELRSTYGAQAPTQG